MSKNKIVAAVDIGSFKIVALIAQVLTDEATFEHSVNIIGAATGDSRGVKKGQIVDIEDAVEAIIIAVEAAERMAGYNLNSAFVSVGGGHISSINSTGVVAISDPNGEVSGADIERVIEAASAVSLPASREIIHVLPKGFIVDGESGVKDPVGMSGIRLEVETHLISASSAALKNLAKTVNEVGVDTDQIVFSAMASGAAVLSPTEKELGCVLIDIGGGTSSVIAFIDGAPVFSGTLPVGARNVTNDLAIGLRVPLEAAEKIKLELSSPENKDVDSIDIPEAGGKETKKISRRTLVEGIIRPRLNEIFSMIRVDLEKAGIVNRIPSGAVITGGGALTVGVLDSAKKMLSLPPRIGQPSGVGGLIDDIMSPSYSTAVGLILHGVGQGEVKDSSTGKIKMPSRGMLGKVMESLKDLLP
ncbi:MAG: Cell division protein FtsA [Candidatus Woesebacteria bacterium GW2011_GWC1_43_10b]|uniref:Cell division protein FtsA n=2 Tax=Candidatus Woeseibacteriota TaxID=1752722 RepID=A0A0G1GDS2_9BACT|nr:MAG: Cell division protein FtsA [Candidatus Woesebacteria bacterium GW2011_GWC1_43_10b]KKT32655.1 MAG: Cell division protein FtsA [Candidatus Woesebacteria bacterium GW2011_GWB1_44_11b]